MNDMKKTLLILAGLTLAIAAFVVHGITDGIRYADRIDACREQTGGCYHLTPEENLKYQSGRASRALYTDYAKEKAPAQAEATITIVRTQPTATPPPQCSNQEIIWASMNDHKVLELREKAEQYKHCRGQWLQ